MNATYSAYIFSSIWFYKQYLVRSPDSEELSFLNKMLFYKLQNVGHRTTVCRKSKRNKHINEI